MSWSVYDCKGNARPIPPDSFVFWSEMTQGPLVSTTASTHVLWCANSMTCFGASLLDSDVWTETLGTNVTGQWRVHTVSEKPDAQPRLTLIKAMPPDLYPPTTGPTWLRQLIQ